MAEIKLPLSGQIGPISQDDASTVEDLFDRLDSMANHGTDLRSWIVTRLYQELERNLKKFYQCRETSLAVTNLQQSLLWRNESSRLWADAETPFAHPPAQ